MAKSPFSIIPPILAYYTNPNDPNLSYWQLCDLQYVFTRLIQVVIGLAGLGLFAMFILGSYKMLTAGNDEKAATQARGTITHAVAGFALFFIAWFILRFIQEFTGINVTIFSLPNPAGQTDCPCPPNFPSCP